MVWWASLPWTLWMLQFCQHLVQQKVFFFTLLPLLSFFFPSFSFFFFLVASNLFSEDSFIILNNQTTCLSEPGTLEWLLDPCCGPFLTVYFFSFLSFFSVFNSYLFFALIKKLVACCVPFSYNTTLDLYTEEAVVSECQVPECAESYYEELSFSLNYLDDANLGCTNGIKVFEREKNQIR